MKNSGLKCSATYFEGQDISTPDYLTEMVEKFQRLNFHSSWFMVENFMDGKFMVEKFTVKKFMVEKFTVKKFMVEKIMVETSKIYLS